MLLCTSIVLFGQPMKADDLPSWNDGRAKRAILEFVQKTTDSSSPHFIPEEHRIATFDNDGTLWSEQPLYFQLAFAIDRVKQLAPEHPEWKEKQPFKTILENDTKTISDFDAHQLVKLILESHAGVTTDEFESIVNNWIATARHPKFGRPYTELVFAPMIELLAYLRLNGYKTYIVSGGGVEFMRPWVEKTYGIPPEQVVGSSIRLKYENQNGKPVMVRLPEIDFIDDKAGKPVGIQKFIGRRPVMAFGNSDGDFEMLEWTTTGQGPRFGLIVHHTDADREWEYDRKSPIGRLDKALDEAPKRGWVIVNMKQDWKVIYPFQRKQAPER
ncbi:MAG: haloacid dehalogenase-like hydrolase [Planctomycetaceae bacterium]|nr:haloacid dehalogenase-like hydrolase [Planctomycetaceae bacterium]